MALKESTIDIKIKLAMLWISFMFFYLYVDYFALYMPNKIADILVGKVFVFEITQGFLLFALFMAAIPMLMIAFSVLLPAKVNRTLNLVVAFLHIPYMLFNLAGEAWLHMILAAIIEVSLLCFIIKTALKWPQQTA